MSITDSILSGSLLLGQDVSWNGETVLTDLCLYTDESTESSQIFDVNFQLEAVINLTAIKLFMLKRDRWKAAHTDPNSSIINFLNELFNEETNLCGTTKKALLIQVNKHQTDHQSQKKKKDTIEYPLKPKSNILLYGEKLDSTLFIYAHPLVDDLDFLPIYESSGYLPDNLYDNKENDQMVLDDIFGNTFELDYDNFLSSNQLTPPTNKLSEIEIIRKINENMDRPSRDLISEFNMAAKARVEEKKQLIKSKKQRQQQQQQTTPQHRISKSTPSKYKPSSSSNNNNVHNNHNTQSSSPYNKHTLEEKKNVVKRMIKETLPGPAKENKSLNQMIYSSIRYTYRNVLTAPTPLDETKLQCIVKMHTDFYNNLESIINVFHPPTTSEEQQR